MEAIHPTALLVLVILASSFASSAFWAAKTSTKTEVSDMRVLMKGLAYYRLISEITNHLEAGSVTKEQYDSIYLYLYEPYEKLGGGGLPKVYMEKLLDMLTTVQPDVTPSHDYNGIRPKYMTDSNGLQYRMEQL